MSVTEQQIQHAVNIIQQGGVIAYPCEGVFGLGCDPFNETAVKKILRLKQRSIDKGLIVVASDWQHVKNLTQPLDAEILTPVFNTWPGPVTWIFPASQQAPAWITGAQPTIALRVTDFPIVKQLCDHVGPLVSTSANIANQPAATTAQDVSDIFADEIDFILDAPVGELGKATPIFDVISGQKLR